MNIRIAIQTDIDFITQYDKHIAKSELIVLISLGRVLVMEDEKTFFGWLRWNLFWDNTPFMNMLYLLEPYRKNGNGRSLVLFWERLMKNNGFSLVMTSTLSNEESQHFYRKLDYFDSGSLLLKNEPLEIIFTKEMN